jgi:hypothetical protein
LFDASCGAGDVPDQTVYRPHIGRISATGSGSALWAVLKLTRFESW